MMVSKMCYSGEPDVPAQSNEKKNLVNKENVD